MHRRAASSSPPLPAAGPGSVRSGFPCRRAPTRPAPGSQGRGAGCEAAAGFGADIGEYVPSLAYRFALVAAERLDAAFTSPRSHDWDLAACDLLVHEAGGRLADLDGEAPRYNRESPRHDALAATNEALMPGLLAMMKEAAGEVARGKRT